MSQDMINRSVIRYPEAHSALARRAHSGPRIGVRGDAENVCSKIKQKIFPDSKTPLGQEGCSFILHSESLPPFAEEERASLSAAKLLGQMEGPALLPSRLRKQMGRASADALQLKKESKSAL